MNEAIDFPKIYFIRGILYIKNECAVFPISKFLNSKIYLKSCSLYERMYETNAFFDFYT